MTVRLFFVVFFNIFWMALSYDLGQVVFIVMSQSHKHHAGIGDETKQKLMEKLQQDGVTSPQVFTQHEDLPLHGGWTIFPLLPTLKSVAKSDTKWFAFLHESAELNMTLFKSILEKYKTDYEIFVGRALVDHSSTIIHHFDSSKLAYPDFKAGFLISKRLVDSLVKQLEANPDHLTGFPKDFSIDASYELAKVISHLHQNGPRLDHEPLLCAVPGEKCATQPRPKSCGSSRESILALARKTLFAVKTCEKYHEERLPIIQDTWASAALNIKYVSEVVDDKFETEVLDGASSNTEQGHCQKTEAIIRFFAKNARENEWKWLVIADDDTILGVDKMIDLLHCYTDNNDDDDNGDFIAIGQRYGFRVAYGTYGYDYQTGGSSMIFNRRMIEKMMNMSDSHCRCYKPDQPDDMHLGACLTNLGQVMVHSERLHQARPEDYHPDLLDHQDPISFHKFWNTDPIKIYDHWFRSADDELRQFKFNSLHPHQEL